MSLILCFMYHISCLTSHVSWFMYHVSCIMSHVSCMFHASCLMYHWSCLTFHDFRVQNRVLKESERSVWAPKKGLERFFGGSLGSKIGSWKHLGSQDRLKMRMRSSRNSFLDHFGGPKEAKIDERSSSDDVKNDNSENVDFWYPSNEKSMFLGPNGAQDGGQMRSKIDFYSDWKWW